MKRTMRSTDWLSGCLVILSLVWAHAGWAGYPYGATLVKIDKEIWRTYPVFKSTLRLIHPGNGPIAFEKCLYSVVYYPDLATGDGRLTILDSTGTELSEYEPSFRDDELEIEMRPYRNRYAHHFVAAGNEIEWEYCRKTADTTLSRLWFKVDLSEALPGYIIRLGMSDHFTHVDTIPEYPDSIRTSRDTPYCVFDRFIVPEVDSYQEALEKARAEESPDSSHPAR